MIAPNNTRGYHIEEATPEDSAALLALLESDRSKGTIEMRYTRRPDPYRSYHHESDDASILLLKNHEDAIKAQVVVLTHLVYIEGRPRKVGYVTGLKKTQDFINFNWLKAFSTYIKEHFTNVDLYYFSVLKDNLDALDVFRKKRKYLPRIKPIGDYSLYFIKTGLKTKTKNAYTFRRATDKDKASLTRFLNQEGAKYDFFPVIEDLDRQFKDLDVKSFYVLEHNHAIIMAGALWDQQRYKQFMVEAYHGPLKLISRMPSLPKLLGLFKLPKTGKFANFATLSFLVGKDDYAAMFEYFIRAISHANKDTYDFITAFRMDADPVAKVFKTMRSITYKSKIHVGYFHPSPTLSYLSQTKKPRYIECGLL